MGFSPCEPWIDMVSVDFPTNPLNIHLEVDAEAPCNLGALEKSKGNHLFFPSKWEVSRRFFARKKNWDKHDKNEAQTVEIYNKIGVI